MNETSQLASAMLTFIFAAGMLIAGQLYIESRSANAAAIVPTRIAQSPAQETQSRALARQRH
jgi:hypothetical protein